MYRFEQFHSCLVHDLPNRRPKNLFVEHVHRSIWTPQFLAKLENNVPFVPRNHDSLIPFPGVIKWLEACTCFKWYYIPLAVKLLPCIFATMHGNQSIETGTPIIGFYVARNVDRISDLSRAGFNYCTHDPGLRN